MILTKKLLKELNSIPESILEKLAIWIQTVEKNGLEETRKTLGFHDEPLKGKRKGQRSIRLNRSYRAIYLIYKEEILFVEVIEVNKHDY